LDPRFGLRNSHRDVLFDVKRPTLTSFVTETDEIRKIPLVNGVKIQYGQGQDVGILIIAGPADFGTFTWYQLLDADRHMEKLEDGTWVPKRLFTPGFVHDSSFPKLSGLATIDGVLYTTTNDSPSVSLQTDPLTIRSTTNETTYRTYLMWQPNTAGSIPVPLRVVTWSVGWGVQWVGGGTGWDLYYKYHSAPAVADTTVHPEWQHNITEFEFIHVE